MRRDPWGQQTLWRILAWHASQHRPSTSSSRAPSCHFSASLFSCFFFLFVFCFFFFFLANCWQWTDNMTGLSEVLDYLQFFGSNKEPFFSLFSFFFFRGSCSQKLSTMDVNWSAGVCELQPELIGIRGSSMAGARSH